MKKFLAFASAVLCAAMLFTSCAGNKGINMQTVENNPGREVSDAVSVTFEKAFNSTPVAFVNKASDSENIHLNASMEMEEQKMDYDFWVSGGLSPRAAVQIKVMDIKAALYADVNGIAVECDKLLGNKAYGIGFKNLSKKLENSVLPVLMNVDVNEVFGEMGELLELVENLGKYVKESAEYMKETENRIYEIISDEGNYSAREEMFRVNDGEVMAVVLDYSITPELVCNVMEEYITSMYESPLLAGCFGAMAAYGEIDYDMLDDYADEAIEEMEYDVYEAFEDMDIDEIPLTVAINKATGALIYAEIRNGDGEKAFVDLGINPEKSGEWIFCVEEGSDEYEIVITKKFDGNNGEFSISSGREEFMKLEIRNGRFELEIDGETAATGECRYTGNALELNIDNAVGNNALKLAIDTNAAPKAPGFKDILTMSEAEIEKLGQTIQINAMRSAGSLGALN